jgi:type I restriction enzyme, S subunit
VKESAQTLPLAGRRFRCYPAYKDSGVDWLGEIPAHWEVKRLRSTLTSCQNGVWGDEPDGINDVVCVRVADFDRVGLRVDIADPTLRSINPRIVAARGLRPGDLLLEKSGGGENQPVGAVVLYEHTTPAVCSNFVARVTIAERQDPRFLTYLHAALYALRVNTRHIKQSTGIQNLDSASYLSESTGLPPEREQRAIAAFLDRETARIDALVAKKDRLIALLQEQRTALITRAVTNGPDPAVPMKDSGVEWLGEIPAHWEVRRIAMAAVKITNGYVGPTRDILVNDGVRYLQSLHIKEGAIDFERRPYFVTSQWSREHEKSVLAAGDVLVVQTGDIGQVAVVPTEFAGCNCHALVIIRLKRDLGYGEWLAQAFQSDYGQGALAWSRTGALHPHLECGHVREIRIAFPPISEQRSILHGLTAAVARVDMMMAKVRDAIEHLKELRAALISAAVTGKIDVREEVA